MAAEEAGVPISTAPFARNRRTDGHCFAEQTAQTPIDSSRSAAFSVGVPDSETTWVAWLRYAASV